MFAPTKVWRRWHRRVNINQRRYAVVSAIAASAVSSLVMARGHRIEKVEEVPLVVSSNVESLSKTKAAVLLLQAINAFGDVEKVVDSKTLRAGKGKMRNRRFRQRRGPLIIYSQDNGIVKAFRNIPGVELINVDALNLLKLAPGGHLGRFCIWTENAIAKLDSIYGSTTEVSKLKKDYLLPTPVISNPDVARIINSDEIQSVLRPAFPKNLSIAPKKRNPLRNKAVMVKLNPFAAVKKSAVASADDKKISKRNRSSSKKFVESIEE